MKFWAMDAPIANPSPPAPAPTPMLAATEMISAVICDASVALKAIVLALVRLLSLT